MSYVTATPATMSGVACVKEIPTPDDTGDGGALLLGRVQQVDPDRAFRQLLSGIERPLEGFAGIEAEYADHAAVASGAGMPFWRQVAVSVLSSRQAMVMGPTPPGPGVMDPATAAAPAKWTSPTSRALPSTAPATRLMPTSMTVAPGLIQSPRTISGRPTAATRISARRHSPARSWVREWAI